MKPNDIVTTESDAGFHEFRECLKFICNECGTKHGKTGKPDLATYHMGECGICGKYRALTEPRDFGHLKQGWSQ